MLAIGTRLGPCDILLSLGAGGFGEVNPELKTRFAREANTTAA
jgi:hypothetical protein